jgi:hypothetical protein
MAITLAVDTYIEVADALQYAEDNGLDIGSGDENTESLLKQATKFIDRKYGNRFLGFKAVGDQPLYWPRVVTSTFAYRGELWAYTLDSDGNPRLFNGIQPELGQAVVEIAAMLAQQIDIYSQPNPILQSATYKVGDLESVEAYKSSTGHQVNQFYKVDIILRPILKNAFGVQMVRGA